MAGPSSTQHLFSLWLSGAVILVFFGFLPDALQVNVKMVGRLAVPRHITILELKQLIADKLGISAQLTAPLIDSESCLCCSREILHHHCWSCPFRPSSMAFCDYALHCFYGYRSLLAHELLRHASSTPFSEFGPAGLSIRAFVPMTFVFFANRVGISFY